MRMPAPRQVLAGLIYAALEENRKERPGNSLPASQIGDTCERKLWLKFRWTFFEKFKGRILRLFRRGQDEEPRLVEDLKAAGLEVTDEQERFRMFGGHYSGAIDGKVLGVPSAEKTLHLLEMKTHNKKSFGDLESKGVAESKPMHEAQMQSYMLAMDLKRALYVAVCKDDDKIYSERRHLDKDKARALHEKALRVITDAVPGPPISEDPSWFECKWCPAARVCRSWELPQINCRTCAHSTPLTDGEGARWHCDRWGSEIPSIEAQLTGCDDHVWNPRLAPWNQIESVDPWTARYEFDGEQFGNGPQGLKSTEIIETDLDPGRIPF